jgi:hypothetical protein
MSEETFKAGTYWLRKIQISVLESTYGKGVELDPSLILVCAISYLKISVCIQDIHLC